jgi:exportin-2 (importin alpha re-exporter)
MKAADDETTDPSIPSSIKTSILEILELYIHRYPELLEQTGGLEAFVVCVWNLVSSTSQTSPISDDGMITQSLRFLATAIRSGHYTTLFSATETVSRIIEDVIVPNVQIREHEIEQIEDNPMEYIRIELSPAVSASSEGSTRRQASADVLRAFVALNAQTTTELAGAWISKGLEVYAADTTANWKAKDTAIYLLTALASRSSTTQVCWFLMSSLRLSTYSLARCH